MNRTAIIIISVVGGIFVTLLLIFLVTHNFAGAPVQDVTLQMWGVFDDSSYYDQAIRDFTKANPNIHIIYKSVNYDDYEQQLINSFAAGTGPDIWLMHNTWLPKYGHLMQPLPQTIQGQKTPLLTIKDFQDQFVDVALDDLTADGQIYALPTYVDTLALYYNKDLFNQAGIVGPPRNYEELNAIIPKLTSFDSRGNIQRSALAAGTARNINRSSDVLMMLMLQSGVQMTDDARRSATFAESVNNQPVGEVALQYYTDFANPQKQVYTWNDSQPYSIDAFVNGQTAMMFNYSHHIATIRDKAARFNFGIAPVPQISGSSKAVTFANYWAPTVAKQSQHPVEAWKFLVYLSSTRGAISYLTASGRPSARRNLVEQQKNDPDLGVFAEQALEARSWYQVDGSAIEKIFADMIDQVNLGRAGIHDALQSAENQVNILMRR